MPNPTLQISTLATLPSTLNWHETSRTTKLIYFAWDPPSMALAYRFYVNGQPVSISTNPTQSSTHFALIPGAVYSIQAMIGTSVTEDATA